MKVLLLGTGAADGIPALFCDCAVCRFARQHGGREIRSRSAALVDGRLKIDLGPDTLSHVHAHRLNPAEWRWVAYTHSHDDHFAPRELQYLFPPFATETTPNLEILANARIVQKIQCLAPEAESLPARVLRPFESTDIGPYRLTGLLATHQNGDEESLNLLIDDGSSLLLYATDTGWWGERTWQAVESLPKPLDLLVVDCAHGDRTIEYNGHMGVDLVLRMRDRLAKSGAVTESSRVVSTHHCHRGGLTYEQLVARLEPSGIEAGYDGMYIEIGAPPQES
ncbi:MAG: hypothetical protein HRF45_13765 [Fimbriimonadia bacterium]|jgi:phosphoribosyl 1,2-cyclic phosphate phosphodiesterase